MLKFELILKNDKRKHYDRLTIFILLFNTAAIAWRLFTSYQSIPIKTTGIITLTLLLLGIPGYFFGISRSKGDYILRVALVATIIYWLIAGYWWIGCILGCLSILYYINNRNLIVYFYGDRIEYPSFPKRIIPWNELSNVMLKDGWLTIDFKNNRIIQQFTEESGAAGNEKEFNDFCRQSLNK